MDMHDALVHVHMKDEKDVLSCGQQANAHTESVANLDAAHP